MGIQMTNLSSGELDTVFLVLFNKLQIFKKKSKKFTQKKFCKKEDPTEKIDREKKMVYQGKFGILKVLRTCIYPILRSGNLFKSNKKEGSINLRKNKVGKNRSYNFWAIRKFYF